MKRKFLLPFCIIILFVACRKANSDEEQLVKVELEECTLKTFGNEPVILCFDSLVQDSRCPPNAVCIWQGVAQGRFSFRVNNQRSSFVLSTNKVLAGTITDTTIQNYTITLVDIQPYAGNNTPSPGFAEVRIKKQ
jgi:hypothetical protein